MSPRGNAVRSEKERSRIGNINIFFWFLWISDFKNASNQGTFATSYFLCLNRCYVLPPCYCFPGLGGCFFRDFLLWRRSIVVVLSYTACGFPVGFCSYFLLLFFVWLLVCLLAVAVVDCLTNFSRLWIFVEWMRDRSASLWCSSSSSWWIRHAALFSGSCRFVFLFPRWMSCCLQPVVCLFQRIR